MPDGSTILGLVLTVIVFLQTANLFQARKTDSKLENMVTDAMCKERAAACIKNRDGVMANTKANLKHVEHKACHHRHDPEGDVVIRPD